MRRKFGKLSTGLLAFLLAVSVVGCDSDADETTTTAAAAAATTTAAPAGDSGDETALCSLPDGFEVGIAIREMVNDVDRDIVNGATEAIEAAGGTVNVTDAGGDARKQNENVESLINSGADGIFVVLGDAQQISPLTKQAADAGIYVS